MKHLALTLSILSIGLSGFSQTKLIAHKSHSGTAENFQLALNSDDFNPIESNFGEAPDRYVINAQLDSVIYVDEHRVILVTSYFNEEIKTKKSKKDKSSWKPDREYVYNHPLFSRQHSLDSIKMVVKRDYHFKNDIDKVVFVGYDNEEKATDENEIIPFSTFPPRGNTPLILLLVLALTGIAYSVSAKSWAAAKI
ncbi:hypothetical protein O3Q51_06200 [Cryomorphaceae bacterium 1068]|nr:hypothetical protein [Cryomorphaceae bacterium 1068]